MAASLSPLTVVVDVTLADDPSGSAHTLTLRLPPDATLRDVAARVTTAASGEGAAPAAASTTAAAVSFPDLNDALWPATVAELGLAGGVAVKAVVTGGQVALLEAAEAAAAPPPPPPHAEKALSRKTQAALADLSLVHEEPGGFAVYVSGQVGVGSYAALASLGITHLANCCDRIPCPYAERLQGHHVSRSFFDVKHVELAKHLTPLHRIIDAARVADTKIVVHCMSGASRSTSTVMTWLMTRRGYTYAEAYAQLRARRTLTRPNAGFVAQMEALCRSLSEQRRAG
eukprot:Rhum_TRINITY_DN9352_c0_g2::Rhum_TRINITY_DN9352_c0_g2_i1::g.33048::m.33048